MPAGGGPEPPVVVPPPAVIVVVCVAVPLLATGSVTLDETVAVELNCPVAPALTLTTTVIVALAPLARVPRLPVTVVPPATFAAPTLVVGVPTIVVLLGIA